MNADIQQRINEGLARAEQAAEAEQLRALLAVATAERDGLKGNLKDEREHSTWLQKECDLAVEASEENARELKAAIEYAERQRAQRDELRQQIAVKDEALKLARGLSEALIGALKEWVALYRHDPAQQTNIQQLQTTIENMGILIAQIDAALSTETKQ